MPHLRKKKMVPASEVLKEGQNVLVRNNEVIFIADDVADVIAKAEDGDKVMEFSKGKFWTLTLKYNVEPDGEQSNIYFGKR